MLNMGYHLQEKTLCSLITAYKTMLPSSLKVKTRKHNYDLYDSFVVLNKCIEEINLYLANIKLEFEKLQNSAEIIDSLEKDKARLTQDLISKAEELSELRKKYADVFVQKVKEKVKT